MNAISNQAASADNSVATRYGGTKKSRVSKKTGRIIAIIALLAAVVVTFWFAFSGSSSMLAYKSVGYQIHDDTSAWVEFEVTKEPEKTVACAVRILSDNAAVAGYRTVVIGPEDDTDQAGRDLTKYYDADIRTDQLGSSGEVENCWYVEDEDAPNLTNLRDY
ncbi:MAG: DUF4307 domain-containing protein [Yaniella sp.]|uniref:DUF4307 domain-containing protein n=1 Tax=Yaniella sp. TaxID=2773929 RepID=UPI002647FAC8|nr:DUF4307 domain-containing protein [Yaniella sp.]MDN5704482.1 DUF4307 domain-containing protein [Yaniella sp.]MDN5731780.1 DUF4307 domain-containing protein [Yaniella sp.]MDN5814899.1 DUF4307 domain-containing protein [Yaniella sp.]MDN5817441.1 DUF4307 domain-containing protein [Yaniella sp.]MDN5837720.1 DUF4307 domain-containing protein [Yaniella sp.]